MNVTFYNFSKKNNSTKQPTGGTALTCEIKESCSILAPVLIISQSAMNVSWNYCHIPAWSRYYFINNIAWINGRWEISCTVDALASWKTQIGGLYAYVLRADSSVHNELITDMAYPATNEFYLDQYELQSVFTSDPVTGIYIVGIISGASGINSVGAISYYAMTSTEFGLLKAALLTNSNLSTMDMLDSGTWNISDMSEEVFKTMYNPYQYIASCMWFPFGINAIPADKRVSVQTIPIGWWDYSLTGYKINALTLEFGEGPGEIKQHPQAITHGAYMNYAPFTRCTIYSRFGVVPLDLSYFGDDSDHISISYYVDLITGQCRARVETYNAAASPRVYHPVSEQHFLLAVPIQIAQIGVDYMGAAVTAISSAANTAQNALSLNVGGAISSAASGIYNTINAAMPQMATSGTNGSFLAPSTKTTVVFQYFRAVSLDVEHKGYPICDTRLLGTMGGFVLCADGDFDIGCTADERTMISGFLTGGFFWE